MADIDDYRALFERTCVAFEDLGPNDDGWHSVKAGRVLVIESDATKPPGNVNKGYGGFEAILKFDDAGKLLEFGIWE